ncbi:hypothetical protein AB0E81_16165 [Streptomyces sp. NPDC033538]|uniref:alpha/beta fold hydrolase n=1 Tax=Streptomyces sp. NPDC033538 TaxID=3155367 RepID=UPI0033C605D2
MRAAAEQSALALPPGTSAQTTADSLTPATLQYELAAAVPGAQPTEPATGHLPFLEQPNQWLETITGFLAKQNDAR